MDMNDNALIKTIAKYMVDDANGEGAWDRQNSKTRDRMFVKTKQVLQKAHQEVTDRRRRNIIAIDALRKQIKAYDCIITNIEHSSANLNIDRLRKFPLTDRGYGKCDYVGDVNLAIEFVLEMLPKGGLNIDYRDGRWFGDVEPNIETDNYVGVEGTTPAQALVLAAITHLKRKLEKEIEELSHE